MALSGISRLGAVFLSAGTPHVYPARLVVGRGLAHYQPTTSPSQQLRPHGSGLRQLDDCPRVPADDNSTTNSCRYHELLLLEGATVRK